MDLFTHITGILRDVLAALEKEGKLKPGLDYSKVAVEPPRDASHGDVASNAAMVLAKAAGMKPRDLAGEIAVRLAAHDDIFSAEIAGPGFINMRLDASFWPKILRSVLAEGVRAGASKPGQGKVNVEYVSANPTGPMHVGHCRGAVFGDALANLLDFTGYDVTREYYINDAGAQVDVLARSVFHRYLEALGKDVGNIPVGFYPGDYLKRVGEGLAILDRGKRVQDGYSIDDLVTSRTISMQDSKSRWFAYVREFAIGAMMELIRDDLDALNVRHDYFFSERSLISGKKDKIAELISNLREKNLVYEGRLEPPKGKPAQDWEDREQTLFRASKFGDDTDRPLIKADGSYTYFASDIAYHADKYERGFCDMIDVWGADHGGYIKRMQAAVKAVSNGEAELDVKICQLVRLLRGGEPVKMSKRSGTFVTLREVVDEVGRDPVRFMMLYRKNDAPLDFDFVKVTEQSRDNPVFYVQYAHARICSVFRNAKEDLGSDMPQEADLAGAPLERLSDEAELALIKRMAAWPRLVEQAAAHHEPHRIAFYLYELASDFHSLWNKGKESPNLRFINHDDRIITSARLALIRATANILKSGLAILGVEAVEEMR